MNVIELKNVGKRYTGEKSPAVHDVSFSVASGEFVCLIGSSGCGKTTLLKLIAGLDQKTSGQIVKPQKVSMAFQSGALFPWLTVFENVALGLRQARVAQEKVRLAVERELRAV